MRNNKLNTFFYPKLNLIIPLLIILFSIVNIYGWFVGSLPILTLIPGGATMKINTAIILILFATCLLLLNSKKKEVRGITLFLLFTSLLIAVLTILSYLKIEIFNIDNLFIKDSISEKLPGRMSPATAVCAILTFLGFIGILFESNKIKKIAVISLKISGIVALISIIAYGFMISSDLRTPFFQSMAINTSCLFLYFSIKLILKFPNSTIYQLITTNFLGSIFFKKMIPLTFLLPIILGFLFLVGVQNNLFTIHFGTISYTSISIIFGLFYVGSMAKKINNLDVKRIKLDNDLKKNNTYLSNFKNGLDSIAMVDFTDKNGFITEVNDLFCEISGYNREELIGNTHKIINSGHHNKMFFKKLWSTINKGDIWVGDIKNKKKTGDYYWVRTSIIPFVNSEGEIESFLAIRQNITKRVSLEEKRKRDLIVLKNKNEELEQFTYIASHDLQEPLRTITSLIELVVSRNTNSLDEISKKSIDFILSSTDRMRNLINNLLDYSLLGQDLKLEKIDVNITIQDVLKDLDKSIQEKKAEIKVSNLPVIFGYNTLLRLLFQNLLSNALKFTSINKKPIIEIGFTENDDEWSFYVIDNGIGIDERHINKIFLIFQRIKTEKKYEGSGIGLAHCKKIVDSHNGRIWATSKINIGSTFNFTISKK